MSDRQLFTERTNAYTATAYVEADTGDALVDLQVFDALPVSDARALLADLTAAIEAAEQHSHNTP